VTAQGAWFFYTIAVTVMTLGFFASISKQLERIANALEKYNDKH
jgi:hypothetical protein